MRAPFCRLRQITDTDQPGSHLGDFNVNPRFSKEGKHVVLSFRGRESMNKEVEFHAAFYLDRIEELYFRLKFELETKTPPVELEKKFQAWNDAVDAEIAAKNAANLAAKVG